MSDQVIQTEPDVEEFGLRFVGGPWDGLTQVTPANWAWHWPLAKNIVVEGSAGVYVKFIESQLDRPIKGILRGAQYSWHEDGIFELNDSETQFPDDSVTLSALTTTVRISS